MQKRNLPLKEYYCSVWINYLAQSLQCNRLIFSVILLELHIFLMFTQWFNMQHTIRHHVVHLSAWQHLAQCTPQSTKGPSQKFAEACETKNVSFILNPLPPLETNGNRKTGFNVPRLEIFSRRECMSFQPFSMLLVTCAIIDPSIAGKFLE